MNQRPGFINHQNTLMRPIRFSRKIHTLLSTHIQEQGPIRTVPRQGGIAHLFPIEPNRRFLFFYTPTLSINDMPPQEQR